MAESWIEVECPFCGSNYNHVVGEMLPDFFQDHYKQGCYAALVVSCEPHPKHLFFVLIGEHKGVVAMTTVIPPHETETTQ